ncbi:MAG: pirin family protein [Halieaceae bacterium]|jgi:redox-sensitive bicupin YhaK (pirin superfamily)|nr:pirin family protein [Halieaceae bacterium]
MQQLTGKTKDLGGFTVTRLLPHAEKRMVGPFIFLDHMGPAEFAPGDGIDVRPHPHIGLATLTYLFEGAMLHQDSLGNHLEILPGDVNWMTAGRGIVHSERETLEVKSGFHRMNGLQAWVALPEAQAEIAPRFEHVSREALPVLHREGVHARVIIGEAFGMASPIPTYSPMFYVDALISEGGCLQRPAPGYECAVYVVAGAVTVEDTTLSSGDFALLDEEALLTATENARVVLLGGEAWPAVPLLEWNFVAFSRERMEQAKADWRSGRFPLIPGDQQEFIPLPEG